MKSIQIGLKALLSLLLVWALAFSQLAQGVDFDWGGTFRIRGENQNSYDYNEADLDFYLSRLRLNGKWTFNQSNIFIELQDARVFNYDDDEIPVIPVGERNQPYEDKLDFHQAYYEHLFENAKIRIGRQKLNLGDQRLVSSLEWVNTARVYDAIRVTLGNASLSTWDIFTSRMVSIDPENLNNHSSAAGVRERYAGSQLHGIVITDKTFVRDGQVEAWYFIRDWDAGNDSIRTIGGRVTKLGLGWEWDIQGSYQSGNFGDLDHSAYMVHMGAEKDMLGGNFAVGFNFATGDDDPSDNNHNTFDNLYPLNHAYYGYMDLFSLQNLKNVEFIYKRRIGERTDMRIAYQGFWLDDTNDHWYGADRLIRSASMTTAAIANGANKYVGSEFDLTIEYPFNSNSGLLVAGLSHFFTGDYVSDTGLHDDPNFWFLMIRTTF